jgi:hypothetical protein
MMIRGRSYSKSLTNKMCDRSPPDTGFAKDAKAVDAVGRAVNGRYVMVLRRWQRQ